MTDFHGFDPESDEVVSREVVPHRDALTERSVARRVSLQALYELDSSKHQLGDVLNFHLSNYETPKIREYILRLVNGIYQQQGELDIILQNYAPDWPIEQVAIVDRNILRIALFEMTLIEEHLPVGVAIDEAIELSKLFGAENTIRFVNGVLGTIANDLDSIRKSLEHLPKSGEITE